MDKKPVDVEEALEQLSKIDKFTGSVSLAIGIEQNRLTIRFATPQKQVYFKKADAIEIAETILTIAEMLPDKH